MTTIEFIYDGLETSVSRADACDLRVGVLVMPHTRGAAIIRTGLLLDCCISGVIQWQSVELEIPFVVIITTIILYGHMMLVSVSIHCMLTQHRGGTDSVSMAWSRLASPHHFLDVIHSFDGAFSF